MTSKVALFDERLGARLVPAGMPFGSGEFDDVVYAFPDLRALLPAAGPVGEGIRADG